MNDIDNEKEILEQAPDFDKQYEILAEEHKLVVKRRKWYSMMSGILVMIVLIFVVSYSTFYAYRPYDKTQHQKGVDVDVDTNNDGIPDVNITETNSGHKKDHNYNGKGNGHNNDYKPVYNIDYFGNYKPTFNYDIYGDGSKYYNPTNQMDSTGTYCILNCDLDNDGWPEYNIDLNGDGKADINIVTDPKNSTTCDLNCDLNYDTLPDINVDTDNDGKADVNITDPGSTTPKYNIDYMGDRIPTFNIKNGDTVTNQVTDARTNPSCTKNCDLDGDGWPDYNIVLDDSGTILNEKISTNNTKVDYDRGKTVDWKCTKQNGTAINCSSGRIDSNNYINIDMDGDGKADINISNDGGNTLVNPLNKEVTIDDKKVILNRDTDKDGFPDYDIDLDNDGLPDMNITDGKTDKCIKNCDSNNDGVSDYLTDIDDTNTNLISITNLNIDYDFDGIYDVNIDTTYDLYPDINIDIDGDTIPDLNIDYNHDGIPDFNIDTDGDGKPNINIDPYGTGVCKFNCVDGENITNPIDTSDECTRNCDTDKNGYPDKYVDIDNDGICDFNCDTENDSDNNYYLDSDYNNYNVKFDINDENSNNIKVANSLDIQAESVDAGWSQNYVLYITNDTKYAVDYQLNWENVSNDFTSENLVYKITRSNTSYIDEQIFPKSDIILKDSLTIRPKTTIKYVLKADLINQSYNQIEDASKNFKGLLKIEIKK